MHPGQASVIYMVRLYYGGIAVEKLRGWTPSQVSLFLPHMKKHTRIILCTTFPQHQAGGGQVAQTKAGRVSG